MTAGTVAKAVPTMGLSFHLAGFGVLGEDWAPPDVSLPLPDTGGEGGRGAAHEPPQVRHDRGHGHADTPQRALRALQPEAPLLPLDDLCKPGDPWGGELREALGRASSTPFPPADLLGALLRHHQPLQVAARVHGARGGSLQGQAALGGAPAHLLHRRQRLQRHAAQ